jgi:hypothetical protein
MNRAALFIIISCILTFCAFRAEPDCARYHTGHFRHKVDVSGEVHYVNIERTEDRQIEIVETTHDTTWHRVSWTGDCHYELTFLRTTMKMSPEMERFRRFAPLKVDIVATGPDYYVFKAWKDGAGMVLQDTLRTGSFR